jgi:hypothetical protein
MGSDESISLEYSYNKKHLVTMTSPSTSNVHSLFPSYDVPVTPLILIILTVFCYSHLVGTEMLRKCLVQILAESHVALYTPKPLLLYDKPPSPQTTANYHFIPIEETRIVHLT